MNKKLEQAVSNDSLLLDLHVHTEYCDGHGTPSEIVEAAIARGLDIIGFSGHSHTDFDEEACMSMENVELYEAAVRQAAEKYEDKIQVYCGIEQDYFGVPQTGVSQESGDCRWDYVIGSVHYVEAELPEASPAKGSGLSRDWEITGGKAHPSMDDTPEIFEHAVTDFFGGDVYAFAEKYFETVGDIVARTGADIIGHFDLFAKFNKGGEAGEGRYFDETHPRYVAAWQKAADKLLKTGAIFEINYGAVNKGYRTEPYPAAPIREYLSERGARFINSSDSHKADTLCKFQ